MIEQIQYCIDVRRAALKQGRSLLQPLDAYGNSDYKKEPLVFNTRTEALAHKENNKHQLFSVYLGDKI